MSRNRIPATWYCHGCQKWHRNSREISGTVDGQKWCDNSIRRGVRDQVNRLPYTSYRLVNGDVLDVDGSKANPR